MLIRLKSLELHGYKTFADQTRFEFPGAVTAIVGPNGSGKSNIADSLRWVLGEQSFSLLRGKKTEDMIFSGSEQRARAGMASATITFDNSDGWLPIDFSEVAITRRAYRDGDNEYLLNGQRVRLKEISELLAKSGLAERTYTIIGQGLVDTALALKADERRKLFEEAAGIGPTAPQGRSPAPAGHHPAQPGARAGYPGGIKAAPSSLERQARKAQEYEQVRADLRMLLRDWYGYHWHRTQKGSQTCAIHAGRTGKALDRGSPSCGDCWWQDHRTAGSVTERSRRTQHPVHTERDIEFASGSLNREMAVLDERETSLIIQMKEPGIHLGPNRRGTHRGYQLALEAGEQEKSRLLGTWKRPAEQNQAQQDYDRQTRTEREPRSRFARYCVKNWCVLKPNG